MTAMAPAPYRPKPIPQLPHALGCACPKYAVRSCVPCICCGRLIAADVWSAGRDLSANWSGDSLCEAIKRGLVTEARNRANPEKPEYWRELTDAQIGRNALESWVDHDVADLVAAVRHYEACDDPTPLDSSRQPRPLRVWLFDDLLITPSALWIRLAASYATGRLDCSDEVLTVDRRRAAEILRDWRSIAAGDPTGWRLRREDQHVDAVA